MRRLDSLESGGVKVACSTNQPTACLWVVACLCSEQIILWLKRIFSMPICDDRHLFAFTHWNRCRLFPAEATLACLGQPKRFKYEPSPCKFHVRYRSISQQDESRIRILCRCFGLDGRSRSDLIVVQHLPLKCTQMEGNDCERVLTA